MALNSLHKLRLVSALFLLTAALMTCDLPDSPVIANGPEINVRQAATPLYSGSGVFGFGNILADGDNGTASPAVTFTIENSGTMPLFAFVQLHSGNIGDFDLSAPPAGFIALAGTMTFTLRFDPITGGAKSVGVMINNNDPDENPYLFTVTGTGDVMAAPSIVVQQAATVIPQATGSFDFGNITSDGAGGTASGAVTFTIANQGSADLIASLDLSAGNTADFHLTGPVSGVIAAGAETTFTVAFDPLAAGVRSAIVRITNNDPDDNPYTFTVTGSGVPVVLPEHFFTGIVTDTGNGLPIAGATITFRSITATTGVNGRFSISLGTTGGMISGDFSIEKPGYLGFFYNSLAADSSTDLDVALPTVSLSSSSSYPTKDLSGRIYYDSGLEIPDGTNVRISLFSAEGFPIEGVYTNYNNGYTVPVRAAAANCTIFVSIENGLSEMTNYAYNRGYNLTGAAPTINFTLNDPTADTVSTNITVNTSAIGNAGAIGYYNPDCSLIQVLSKHSGIYSTDNLDFSISTSANTNIVDYIAGSQILLIQNSQSTVSGAHKYITSISELLPIPASNSSLTLPPIVDNGPWEAPNVGSITYAAGTLSINPVNGANYYRFLVWDTATGVPMAIVNSSQNSIMLPVWLQQRMAGKTVEISITPGTVNNFFILDNLRYGFFISQGVAPNMAMAMLYSSTGSFSTTINIP